MTVTRLPKASLGVGQIELLPAESGRRAPEFVDYYNLRRYHESLNNLTQNFNPGGSDPLLIYC